MIGEILVIVMAAAVSSEITFHNLPHSPAEAYEVSDSIFIAKIHSVNPKIGNVQTIKVDFIEQLKGHADVPLVILKNGNIFLKKQAGESREQEKDTPLFYAGYQPPGKVGISGDITFTLDDNDTFLVMLAPYGMHEYSFLPVEGYPKFTDKVRRGEVPKKTKYSFKDFMPYYDYVYEVDCNKKIVLNRRISKDHPILKFPDNLFQEKILSHCGGQKEAMVYLFGLYHSDLMITDYVWTARGWVFPWSISSYISTKTFFPFKLVPVLNKYYRVPETGLKNSE